jgi:hypothetical protein
MMKSLDAFLTALVITIFVLSVINTILYLRREKRNGVCNHSDIRDNGTNGES